MKEQIKIEESNESTVIKELKEIIEQQKGIIAALSRQIDQLNKTEIVEQQTPQTTKVTQINMDGKRYFCSKPEEQEVFRKNYPNAKTESFEIEMQPHIAKRYMEDPENKKAFERKTA